MNITEFFNSPTEVWQAIPRTKLSASSYGRIRNDETHQFFGQIEYMEDVEGILDGSIQVWDTRSVSPTLSPRSYFDHRTRRDRLNEAEFFLEAA